MMSLLIATLSVALVVLAVFLAWRAAKSAETPQGAVGWVVFLLTAPYLAVPVYAIFGPHRYARRERRHRASQLQLDRRRPARPEDGRAAPDGIARRPFEKLADLPVCGGNRVDLLIDGAATFQALFAAIDAAERYVLVQFYTFRDDDLGRDMAARMEAAARRGVRVCLYFDLLGSTGLSTALIDRMARAGVQVLRKRRIWQLTHRFQINYRNHRKIVVVDGRAAFLGGLNVGDEYMGRSRYFGPWRDTFCRIEGPLVQQAQLIFAEDWHSLTGEVLDAALDWAPPDPAPGGIDGLVVATGPAEADEAGMDLIFAACVSARRRLWISSAYFVPDTPILSALKHAAQSGVDVRVMVPDRIDHYLPWLAAFAYFDELIEAGVQILRYKRGFLHQKAVLVDDGFCAIGSVNLDNRSFRLNFEVMGLFFDDALAAEVAAMFEADFASCARLETRLADQSLAVRVGAPAARLLAPIL